MSSSRRSSASCSIAGSTSPLISPHSSPELVLVNEVDSPNEELDFSSDDDLLDESSARLDRPKSSPIPPLSPTVILLYLSIFYLKLGPMFLPTSDTPLSQSLPTLVACAIFAASARQMWYLLARYLHKVDMEDVILDVFAGSPSRRRTRLLRTIVRFGTSTMRILLASVSLRVSVDALLPLVPARFLSVARGVLTAALALVLLPLYAASSLAAKRIVYATWASLLAYLTWLGAVSYAHVKGTLSVGPPRQSPGVLWQGITTTAFIFSSSWTLPLYVALRGLVPPAVPKRPRRRSFKALIAASVTITVALVLPLCLFASSSNSPSTPAERREITLIAISGAANIILTIPAILITVPPISLPFANRRATSLTISKFIIYMVTTAFSLLPSGASVVLGDLLLVFSLLGTYVLPAILHITVHYFKRPLSIVLPTSVVRAEDGEGDELLQRKERSLQRRRLGRRVVWDAVAWISVFPLGVGGSAWAVGRVLGKW